MSKLIIYVTGKPLLNGYKIRDFLWSAPHNRYLYQGKEFEVGEFNENYERATRANSDLGVRVMVVGAATEAARPVSAPKPREAITAEEAEEVLRRERPDLLKKKPGPRAHAELEVG